MSDGNDVRADLSRGMYDAGYHIKFGLPMDFTATLLSWSVLEYGDHMDVAHQIGAAQSAIRWITYYFINAHRSSNVLYIGVYPGIPCHLVSLKILLLPIWFFVCQILHLKS